MPKHKKVNKILSSIGIVLFVIIIIGAAAASMVLESGIMNVSHAQLLQRLPSIGSKVTTPGQNPMCDPNNLKLRHVNTTESHVCGIPKTPSATGAAGTTTTESPSSISPTSRGSMTPPSGSPLESIPGLLPITTNNTQ